MNYIRFVCFCNGKEFYLSRSKEKQRPPMSQPKLGGESFGWEALI
jgi:hypothetical protein